MKKIIFAFLALLSVVGMRAADAYTLSYCEHKIASSGGYGADNAGEIAGAIFVPQTKLKSLVGNQISRIDVGLISRINVKEMTVWVRRSLDGENLAEATIERGALGWNEISLDKPYTITAEGDGLYIGFNYKNSGSSHPVSFVGTGAKGLSFFKATATEAWHDMADKGNLSLEAVVTGSSLPMYDLSLDRASITPNIALGQTGYTVTGVVSNVAMKDVTGFTLRMENASGFSQRVKVSQLVKSGQSAAFKADFVADVQLTGMVNVTIESLVDGADANMDNNSLTAGVAFLRNVVVEEFTTERCPNCPPAANAFHATLESGESFVSRIVPVCHHAGFNTDGFTRQCDKDLLFLFNDAGTTYAPAFMFDRRPIFNSRYKSGEKDNVAPLNEKAELVECIEEVLNMPTHALVGISVNDVRETEAGTELTFEVSVMADDEFNVKNPVLTVYSTEDDVKAKKQEAADGDFYHQHLIRTDNGTWGDEVTFTDHVFTKTYTITLDKAWNREKMHIVAFVSNHDATNPLNNAIENAASVDVYDVVTGICNTVTSSEATVIGRYNISGQRASRGQKGIQILKLSDGRSVKVLK